MDSLEAAQAEALLRPYIGVRERDLLRGDATGDGVFIAEGEVVVRVLVQRGRFAVRSLLLEARRVEPLRDVIDALPESVPVYVVPQSVMDGIVGFAIHRGILALGSRGVPLTPSELLGGQAEGKPELLVGLVGLANHDNVGSIFRSAAAFGVRGVLLDDTSCDPLYRKAIRVSVGGALVVPFARSESATAMLDAIEAHGWEPIALTPRGEETFGNLGKACSRRVLLMGTEGEGLPDHVLTRARRVRIDMEPTLDSLNVAVATGIAIYEATQGMRAHARR
ncbi:23S ribosomal RNA methyltransferase [Labilithrix luteola]|uniref:23S ribosomal RNA methyltransferase n=1 Tax=Labilithrix luteola TaxID=1391654 RepID=A0A0K1Q8E1_9BACT|nr:23S ribosomal RNA methyltransferase [Labilithrix luteola]